MADKSKLICPHCGAEMNHHSDKLLYTSESLGVSPVDSSLGGRIYEFHACPGCGSSALRAA